MASWIVLDWDQDQFHIVVAENGRRGTQVTRALTWTHPEPFTPSTAGSVGKALRAFLDAAKIAPAPVIVGVGRDRVFLKELRFPAIEAHEEASLVRFQTAKELTESIESYAVDYMHLGAPKGEREIMTVAGRRDIIGMVQTLCQAAGLKLHAVTPRVFGVAHAVKRAVQPDPNPLQPNSLSAVLTIGTRWAELCFFRGDRLLQAQAIANGPLLVSEIKRNLAVFQSQHAVNVDLSGPDCLYVFSKGGAVVEALQAGLTLPLRLLDPLRPEPAISADLANAGSFAGAVGLATSFQGADAPAEAPTRSAVIGGIAALCGLGIIGYFLVTGLPTGCLFSALKFVVFMTGLVMTSAGLFLFIRSLLTMRAAGLFSGGGRVDERPVNLATPRRQTAPVSAGKQRGLLWGVGAAVGLVLFVGMLWGGLYYQRTRLARLITERDGLEKQLSNAKQERAEIEAYKDWEQSTIPWLDELYDLSARYPYQQGFRVNQLRANATGNKKAGKDIFIAKIDISGIMPLGKDSYVQDLTRNMGGDAHIRPNVDRFNKGQYDMKIEIAHQEAKDYKTALIKPVRPVIIGGPPVEEKKEADPNAEDDDS